MGRRWTVAEDRLLKEEYPLADRQDLCQKLGRTWNGIKVRARQIGVKRDIKRSHPTRSAIDRFSKKYVTDSQGCWIWQDYVDKDGYGVFRGLHGTWIHAHRFSYSEYVGDVLEGTHIHHLCGNQSCVNPQHLNQLNASEHILQPGHAADIGRSKTHCIHGHKLSGSNLYVQPSTGYRYCRTCKRASEKRCRT